VSESLTSPFPCPCCGHLVFADAPGSYDICPVCFWEDDISQLRWPDLGGGANSASLIEAQETYRRIGASDERFVAHVRAATSAEPMDSSWRPFDLSCDNVEDRVSGTDYGVTYSHDQTAYYYWRQPSS
jgi:hypothetical protein